MNSLLRHVIYNTYGIDTNQIVPYKKLWKVYSENKEYIIKPYEKSKRNVINRIYFLNRELNKKGFKQFPGIIINNHDQPWFKVGNSYFIIMPYIDGRTAQYTNLQDIEKIVKLLASFHHHGALFNEYRTLPNYQPIYFKMEKRLNKFIQLYNQILVSKERDSLDKEVLNLGKEMVKYGTESLNLLNRNLYNRLLEVAKNYRMIAHRDVASHNFLINDQEWIIDFDISGIEPQLVDLMQLIGRIMSENNWDISLFLKIEKLYNSYRRLDDDEQILIRQLLLFPNDFYREVLGAYYIPDKFNRDKVYELLKNYSNSFDKYKYFRKNLT